MFTVHITEKGGATSAKQFEKSEISIGRVPGNDIVLRKNNISKRHARIINNGGSFVIIDSKSTNGTYINGKRIDAPYDLGRGDKIYVGDFTLELEAEIDEAVDFPPEPSAATPEPEQSEAWSSRGDLDDDWADEWDEPRSTGDQRKPSTAPAAETAKPEAEAPADSRNLRPTVSPGDDQDQDRIVDAIHESLLHSLALKDLYRKPLQPDELRRRTRTSVEDVVAKFGLEGRIPDALSPSDIAEQVTDEAVGFGPLEDLMTDDSVTEILVNSPSQVYVEVDGVLELSERRFSGAQAILGVIDRLSTGLGRQAQDTSPIVEARLSDGSRINAIVPPLALNGPTLTIRKFNRAPLSIAELIDRGAISQEMADFLEIAVQARKSIVVSGGSGSGKTTTLNAIAGFIPTQERIITIEDGAELKLDHAHVIRLESRPPNGDGHGAISLRELIRNALRMRPDRIVVGECSGPETLDTLHAMSTGNEGSLLSVHANSPQDTLARLETMVLMARPELPIRLVRQQIDRAADLIVHQTRFPDGSRKTTRIVELNGIENDAWMTNDIFVFSQQGVDGESRVQGEFEATGLVPKFYDDLDSLGVKASRAIFG